MTDNLPERVELIEQKLGALSASVDRRFDEVDRRFDEVDRRFDEVDRRLNEVDRRLNEVERRFDEVTGAIVEQRQYTEFAFDRLRAEMIAGFETVATKEEVAAIRAEMATKEQVARLERKLDQFIDRWSGPPPRRPRPKKR